MKHLLAKGAAAASASALVLGALALTASPSQADGRPLPESLQETARTVCAYVETVGPGAVAVHEPEYIDAVQIKTTTTDDGDVARWALVRTWVEGLDVEGTCIVAEVIEPAEIKDRADSKAAFAVESPGGFAPFDLRVVSNTAATTFDGAVTYDQRSALHGFEGTFTDHDHDPATPRLARFGGQFVGNGPSALQVHFTASGRQSVGGVVDVERDVVVQRTQQEKATALKVRQASDRKAHGLHQKLSRQAPKDKAKARLAVKADKSLSAKQKAAKLKKIGQRYKKLRVGYRADCRAARATSKNVYLKAIAPYKKRVTVQEPSTETVAFSRTAEDGFEPR